MQAQKLSRKEQDKLRNINYILSAALELFSENGYYNVTMNEIASKVIFRSSLNINII